MDFRRNNSTPISIKHKYSGDTKESRVTEKATIPMKADAASSISMKAVIVSLNVTVPARSERAAPIPAAKPKLTPCGRLIIR